MAMNTALSQVKKIMKAKNFEKGEYKVGEKPSDFAGVWKGKERSLSAIRKKAWTKK